MSRSFRWEWTRELTAADSEATATQRLVGLVLADFYVNSETGTAWPAAETLAARTALNEKSVRRALYELVDLGFLVIAKRSRTISWMLTVPASRTHGPMSTRAEGPMSPNGSRTLTPATSDTVSPTPDPLAVNSDPVPDEPLRRGVRTSSGSSARATPPLSAPTSALADRLEDGDQLHCPYCPTAFTLGAFSGVLRDCVKELDRHVRENHPDEKLNELGYDPLWTRSGTCGQCGTPTTCAVEPNGLVCGPCAR